MTTDIPPTPDLLSELQPLDALRAALDADPAWRVSTMPKDDHTLMRFLKARGYSVPQAQQMLLECAEWRRSVEGVGIDELYRRIDPFDFPARAEVVECWPMGFHKTDRLGRPINIQTIGGVNLKQLYKHVSPATHWQTVLVSAEALTAELFPAASAAARRPIAHALVIVDLKGLGLGHFWALRALARRALEVSQAYFPETMGQLAIVNAPPSFAAIWAAVRPWLAPRTRDKVAVLPDAAALRELVAPENLPAALGGTCACAGPGGCAGSGAGPWMAGRAERRAAWLRGERARPGVDAEPASVAAPVLEKAQEKGSAQAQSCRRMSAVVAARPLSAHLPAPSPVQLVL
ncbi:CRAL-TRIO domain-containing protein [Gloeopeniophorella convolvens]|nr:CRAL-TRIO domain-containing protein [Gloeopeniophorella convolvens]